VRGPRSQISDPKFLYTTQVLVLQSALSTLTVVFEATFKACYPYLGLLHKSRDSPAIGPVGTCCSNFSVLTSASLGVSKPHMNRQMQQ
jgi:hypothetical protein